MHRRILRGILIAIPMRILGATALWLIVVMRTGRIQPQPGCRTDQPGRHALGVFLCLAGPLGWRVGEGRG